MDAPGHFALLRQLREDALASELLADTWNDAARGRMTDPVPVESFDLGRTLLHPRFPNVKVKPDGSTKVRSVDHMSWSAFGHHKAGTRCQERS